MVAQKLRDLPGNLDIAIDTQRDRLDTLESKKTLNGDKTEPVVR